ACFEALPGAEIDGIPQSLTRPPKSDLQHPRIADRDRLRPEDRPGCCSCKPDKSAFPSRKPDRLRIRGRRRDLWVRRRSPCAIAVCVIDLENVTNPHDG